VLVGLPGSGKSSVGRRLARRLGLPFVDLDVAVERRAGRSIPELFAGGEAEFRALEAAMSAELAALPPLVLAPGGGWMANAAAVAPLRPVGRIIYLRVTPETAIRRMGAGRMVGPCSPGPIRSARCARCSTAEPRRMHARISSWTPKVLLCNRLRLPSRRCWRRPTQRSRLGHGRPFGRAPR
jgi:hypothetical protein